MKRWLVAVGLAWDLVGGVSLVRADAYTAIRERDAAQTVVLANRLVPESIELATLYMAARGIPSNHLCVLELPTGEAITRRFYNSRLRDPLLAFLREQGLIDQVKRRVDPEDLLTSEWRTVASRLRYAVSMMGIPLRIAENKAFPFNKISRLTSGPLDRDTAAVDSELACLLWDTYELRGVSPNPFYNLMQINRAERQARPVLLAARLDGPDAGVVRRMIDDALYAERHGLSGRAYVDTRSVADPDYQLGDHWLREAAERLSRLGLDVTVDTSGDLFPASFPMEHAALYLGWYSEHVAGPFQQPDFAFRRGAVAYHLHSGSAKSLRTRDQHWAGPLLVAGAAAVMGAVDEPYLSYTPDLQVFTDRLVAGYSLGEAAYLAQRALSWQITVVGDPLYRPFAALHTDAGGTRDEGSEDETAWEHVRRMNLLASQQQLNIALAYGRDALRQGNTLPVREKLADLYARNELWPDALREYQQVSNEAVTAQTAVRVGQRAVLALRLLKRTNEADALEKSIRTRWPDSPYLPHLTRGLP